MGAWQRLGRFISGHMMVIMPVCVAAGVLAPQAFIPLRPFVATMFAVMAFQGSLSNTLSRVRDTFRRPALLVFVLLFAHVLVPLVTFGVAGLLFGDNPDLMAGVALEYSVPIGSTAVVWAGMCSGDVSLALSAVLISALVCPFSIPATMHLLMGAVVEVDAVGMMEEMLLMVALPAVAATLLNDRTHGWAARELSPRLAPAARILLVLIVTTNATGISDLMFHLTPQLVGVMAFTGVLCVAGYAAGLGVARLTGQPHERRVSLAFTCGMRNISAGAVIASEFLPAAALFPVMIGTLFQQFLAATCAHLLDGSREVAGSGLASRDATAQEGARLNLAAPRVAHGCARQGGAQQ